MRWCRAGSREEASVCRPVSGTLATQNRKKMARQIAGLKSAWTRGSRPGYYSVH
jgi:hypothetical protein